MIRATVFTSEGARWNKSSDFIDGLRRYTLFVPGHVEGEGGFCDRLDSPLRWFAIVAATRTEYGLRYDATFEDCAREAQASRRGFRSAEEARQWCEGALYVEMVANGAIPAGAHWA